MGFSNKVSLTEQPTIPSPAENQKPTKKTLQSNKSNASWLPSTKTALAAAGTMAGLGTSFYINQQRTPQPVHTAFDTIGTILKVFVPLSLFAGVTGLICQKAGTCKTTPKEEENHKFTNAEANALNNKLISHNTDTPVDQLKGDFQEFNDYILKMIRKNSSLNEKEECPKEELKVLIQSFIHSLTNHLKAAAKTNDKPLFTLISPDDPFTSIGIYITFEKLYEINPNAALELMKTCHFIVNDNQPLDLLDIVNFDKYLTRDAGTSNIPNRCSKCIKKAFENQEIKDKILIACIEEAKNQDIHDEKRIHNNLLPDFFKPLTPPVLGKFLEAFAQSKLSNTLHGQSIVVKALTEIVKKAASLKSSDDKEKSMDKITQAFRAFCGAKNYDLMLKLLSKCASFLKYYQDEKFKKLICTECVKICKSSHPIEKNHIMGAFHILFQVDRDKALDVAETAILELNNNKYFDLHDIAKMYDLYDDQLTNFGLYDYLGYKEPTEVLEKTNEAVFHAALRNPKSRQDLFLRCIDKCAHDPEKYKEAFPRCFHKFDPEVLTKFLEKSAGLNQDQFKDFQRSIVYHIGICLQFGFEENFEGQKAFSFYALDIFMNAKREQMIYGLICICDFISDDLYNSIYTYAKSFPVCSDALKRVDKTADEQKKAKKLKAEGYVEVMEIQHEDGTTELIGRKLPNTITNG
jgi:hypothetical protein